MKITKILTFAVALTMLTFTLTNCVPTAALLISSQVQNYHISLQKIDKNKHKLKQGTYGVAIEEDSSKIKSSLSESGILMKEVEGTIITEEIAISDKYSVQYRLNKKDDSFVCKPTVLNPQGVIIGRELVYNKEATHNKRETIVYTYLIQMLDENNLDYSFMTKEVETKDNEIEPKR